MSTSAKDSLLATFDHEMAITRRVLERVPEQAFAWKPHEKSFSLGGLATHLAQLPHWGTRILTQDAYDLAMSKGQRLSKATLQEVLETFDAHVAEVRQHIATRETAELQTVWTLKRNNETVMSMPKLRAFESFLIHHVIHHRGQMTVYLRLQDVPIPPIYGSTADELL